MELKLRSAGRIFHKGENEWKHHEIFMVKNRTLHDPKPWTSHEVSWILWRSIHLLLCFGPWFFRASWMKYHGTYMVSSIHAFSMLWPWTWFLYAWRNFDFSWEFTPNLRVQVRIFPKKASSFDLTLRYNLWTARKIERSSETDEKHYG